MDEQGGFRVGRGCTDQIFTVKQIVEKVIEKDKKVYMAFVDLEKANDYVNRGSCGRHWKSMGCKGSCLGQSRHYMKEARHV